MCFFVNQYNIVLGMRGWVKMEVFSTPKYTCAKHAFGDEGERLMCILKALCFVSTATNMRDMHSRLLKMGCLVRTRLSKYMYNSMSIV